MDRDNQPTFNINRNIVNFKDFKAADEKGELEEIKRTTTPNSERQQVVGNPRYKFNKVTHKMDELSPDMVEDSIDALEENYGHDEEKFVGRHLALKKELESIVEKYHGILSTNEIRYIFQKVTDKI